MDGNPQLWIVRAGAALFSVFGGLALGLAVVGLYGVKAYSVARRTREIGIRMALGAQGKTVQWMILREGIVMVAAGLALGFLFALGTGKIVSSILFEVSALDPLAFTIAPLVLAHRRACSPPGSPRAAPPASVPWPPCAPNERSNDERSSKPDGIDIPETKFLPRPLCHSGIGIVSDFANSPSVIFPL